MRRALIAILCFAIGAPLGLVLVFLAINVHSVASRRIARRDAINQLRALKITVEQDDSNPGGPVRVKIDGPFDDDVPPFLKSVANVDSLEINEPAMEDAEAEALFSAMPQLRSLKIANGQGSLTDGVFPHIGRLENLEYLCLIGTGLSESRLSCLTHLKNLRSLFVWTDGVRPVLTVSRYDSWNVNRFPKLEHITLRRANIRPRGFEAIGTLHLRSLSLQGCSFDHGLAGLGNAETLRQLYLDECYFGDDHLKDLGKLTALETLSLERTNLDDRGLARLTGLTNLGILMLNKTKVTDDAAPHLAKLTNLRLLHAKDTGITEKGLGIIWESVPDAQIKIGASRYSSDR